MARCDFCGKKIGLGDIVFQYKNADICGECKNIMDNLLEHYDGSVENEDYKFLTDCINSNKCTTSGNKAIMELCKEADLAINNNKKKKALINSFKMTTGFNFENEEIVEYLGIVSGEIVLGTGFLSELSASINDFFGTSSTALEGKLSKAKNAAQENLKQKALAKGANAVIGVDFDITTFSNNIIVVSANGTAVLTNIIFE